MKEVRAIAFYLPQFHSIPENDTWWGKGFTEWTNLATRTKQFEGHILKSPTTLGEYNLTEGTEAIKRQVNLAKQYGVAGFCFYFYWFDNKRLLEKPLDAFLESNIDFPFCVSWANENWTRRWDGKDAEVLISQKYNESTPEEVFSSFEKYLIDPRYMQQGGSKILIVHRASHIPEAKSFVNKWRELARNRGIGELHLIAAETEFGLDPREYGFDAVAEFPPVGANTLSSAQLIPPPKINPEFRGRLMSYPRAMKKYLRRKNPNFLRYSGVMPSWDNTARRKHKATIYLGSDSHLFSIWMQSAIQKEQMLRNEKGLVFINAWNEWAESAVLEPNDFDRDSNLQAVQSELPQVADSLGHSSGVLQFFQFPWVYSIAQTSFATCLNLFRSLRRMIGS